MTIEEVRHKTESGSLENLNNILYSFSKIALLSYSLDLKRFGVIDLNYTENDLLSELARLKSLRNRQMQKSEEWIKCDSISELKNPKFVYRNIENPTELSYGNIQDQINQILTIGEQYHDCQSQTKCTQFLSDILSVSLGTSYLKLRDSIKGLILCEQERVKKLKAKVFIVSLLGFSVFFLTILFTLVYLKCIESFLQNLWKTLGFNLENRFKHFRKMVNERLIEVHQINEYSKQKDENNEKEFNIKKHRHYLRYIARFIVLFLLSLCLYFTNTIYFCEAIYKLLNFQPELLGLALDNRNSFSLLNFITLDKQLNTANLSTVTMHNFIDYEKEQKYLVNRISKSTKHLTDFEKPSLISPDFNLKMNDKIENTKPFLKLGIINGIKFLLQESDFLLSQKLFLEDSVRQFNKNCDEIVSLLSSEFDLIHSFTVSVILLELQNQLIYFMLAFLFLFTIYYYFYYKYLDNEVKVIHSIISFINLVPSINHLNSDNPN